MKQRLLIADLSQVELIKEQETIKDSQMEVQESIEIHLGYNISQIDSSKQLLIQSAFILIYYILNSLQSHNQKLCKICLYNISVDKLSCLRGQTLLEMEMFSFEQQAICLYLDWNL
ncbi:unnamed protein product (macronuclear) [Paramecium tetraurelia]|uniref:Uncharacterized protein n=1 Tax=Paramecium tetraurelia TaxID=5888 RepID=A0BSY5_PARTE|nr:uncharacterized protein GSPATT00031884001 [Paramecium tetraurelia]CAK61652.1 unnamed protein product [Paramecium tetraurelia]|eukprot:XP_001429050.1 hypothetical protein (macronuclear) [Paramecium tetraurelia strain d4-2]